MSAQLLVLPRLWATAAEGRGRLSIAHAAGTIATRKPAQTFVPGLRHLRKGPHSLRLVQAQAAQPLVQPAKLVLVAPRTLPMRPQPELAIYRKYTEAMLRRYLKLSMEAGRVPSLIGQDMFRGNVSHCRVTGFDDVVIFVEDVNKCLARLAAGQRYLVRKIAIEGYTQGETAALRGLSLRTVFERYTGAIDQLTEIFLECKLLNAMVDAGLES